MTLPLVEELVPAPDPWDVARHFLHWHDAVFLDSANESPLGRYSFVAADPFAHVVSGEPEQRQADPFVHLAELLQRYPADTLAGLPPFQGGAVGFFGYGLSRWIERLPRPRHDEFLVADMAVGLFDWVVAFDHVERRAWLISTGYPETGEQQRIRRATRRALWVLRQLKNPILPAPLLFGEPWAPLYPQHSLPDYPTVTSNFSRAGYEVAVRRAIEYIHAGDCFQVNLSQRLLAPFSARADFAALYDRLRLQNPAPFGGLYSSNGQLAVLSASPERFLRVTPAGDVETRPIKGTRPRGRTPEEDTANRAELLASAKDRAENVMIVDLLRNDLGRVCEYGSVRVAKVCDLESYRTVHHLVSEVHGKLRAGMGPIDLLRAAFPGGSVTGAPKVRAMEIIAELEPTARGPYCGSLGYVGFDGSMDTNILIRTFTVAGGWAQFPVGGGIVADSDPGREYEETLHKAAGLLRALE